MSKRKILIKSIVRKAKLLYEQLLKLSSTQNLLILAAVGIGTALGVVFNQLIICLSITIAIAIAIILINNNI
jgi:uncharacterized protein (DUF2062 family)